MNLQQAARAADHKLYVARTLLATGMITPTRPDRAARSLLAERGYDPQLGARPLRRAIQRLVEDPLSEKILWKEFHAGDTVVVDAENEEIVFRSVQGVEPPPVELAGSGTPE